MSPSSCSHKHPVAGVEFQLKKFLLPKHGLHHLPASALLVLPSLSFTTVEILVIPIAPLYRAMTEARSRFLFRRILEILRMVDIRLYQASYESSSSISE